MLLALVVDHAHAGRLEHALHLAGGGGGGEVHVLRPDPAQQVPHRPACDAQLVLLPDEQLWATKNSVIATRGPCAGPERGAVRSGGDGGGP